MKLPRRHVRGFFYVVLLVTCPVLVAAMVATVDRNTRLIAQWTFVAIVIALLVDVAIRGDDDRQS